tara:strand:- start:218 stop:883 length:666 start_codon:yes stop_codon:yes gene_type:complete
MKIVFLSDTHGLHDQMKYPVPDGDVLVHCGDAMNRGISSELCDFAVWFNEFPHEHKIYVPGNHDHYFAENLTLSKEILNNHITSEVTVLVDEEVVIDGLKFYGSPWTRQFYTWAFMKDEKELKDVWATIPNDTDILITHGPPKSILDINDEGQRCGSKSLRDKVWEVKPLIHAFGHIHEAYGVMNSTHTKFLNLSVCNRKYQPVNKPVVVDINDVGEIENL